MCAAAAGAAHPSTCGGAAWRGGARGGEGIFFSRAARELGGALLCLAAQIFREASGFWCREKRRVARRRTIFFGAARELGVWSSASCCEKKVGRRRSVLVSRRRRIVRRRIVRRRIVKRRIVRRRIVRRRIVRGGGELRGGGQFFGATRARSLVLCFSLRKKKLGGGDRFLCRGGGEL